MIKNKTILPTHIIYYIVGSEPNHSRNLLSLKPFRDLPGFCALCHNNHHARLFVYIHIYVENPKLFYFVTREFLFPGALCSAGQDGAMVSYSTNSLFKRYYTCGL